MIVSKAGLDFIAGHEGVVTTAYRDPAGIWTIGVGHTSRAGPPMVKPGMRITRAQAMDIFADDIRKFELRVEDRFRGQIISQAAFDASVSFDYNTGAINKASWVKYFLAGNNIEARRRLMLWNKAGGRVLPGLTRRRKEEADMLLSGSYHGRPPEPSTNYDTKEYQWKLAKLGYPVGEIDGIYGPKTKEAVTLFQKDHSSLVVDGILGPATATAIDRELQTFEPPVVEKEPSWLDVFGSIFKFLFGSK